MSRYLRLYLRRRATPARAKRASPRSLSIITASVLWALRSCANEAAQHSSAMHAICTGPSTGSGTDLPPLPTAPAHRVACDPEARREASRSVCSDFRKSIRFHTEMLICRCNASSCPLASPRLASAPSVAAPLLVHRPLLLYKLSTLPLSSHASGLSPSCCSCARCCRAVLDSGVRPPG